MNKVQSAWEDMRISYQVRYANMCKKIKENEFNTANQGAMLEMSYVLINFFGLSRNQIRQVEKNGGLTNEDMI